MLTFILDQIRPHVGVGPAHDHGLLVVDGPQLTPETGVADPDPCILVESEFGLDKPRI